MSGDRLESEEKQVTLKFSSFKLSDETQRIADCLKDFDRDAFIKWYIQNDVLVIGSRSILEYIMAKTKKKE